MLSPQLYPQYSDCVAAQAAAQQQGQITQPCHQASLVDYHYQVCPQGGVCGLSALESPTQDNCQLNQATAQANGLTVGPCQMPAPQAAPAGNQGPTITYVCKGDNSQADKDNGCLPNPLGTTSLYTFFQQVIAVIIQAGTYVLVVMIIYSGFLFVTAQGNEGQIGRARQTLLYTVIGGAILLGAWILAVAVANTVASL